MLIIRLQRVGRKNLAAFRVIVTESSSAVRSGKNVEALGSYDPHTHKLEVKTERVLHWIKNGAQLSDTIHNLFITKGIIAGKKINALPKKTVQKKEGETAEATPPASPATPAETAPEEKQKDTKEVTAPTA
jgi:small subunit ribosomal protein S16